MLQDLFRLQQAPWPLPLSNSERPHRRTNKGVPQGLGEMPEVLLGLGVGVHPLVHGGTENDRRPGDQKEGGEKVIGHPLGRPGQEVGRGRSHHHHIGFHTETDVKRRPGAGEEIGMNLSARDPLEGKRLDEALGASRHNNVDPGPQSSEVPGQLNGLIRGDSAGDPQDHPAPLPGASAVQDPDGHEVLFLQWTPVDEAKLDLAGGKGLESASRKLLLLPQGERLAGEGIQLTGVPGGDEDAQVFAVGVLRYIVGGKNMHGCQVLLMTV